jgi:hypothetical protein
MVDTHAAGVAPTGQDKVPCAWEPAAAPSIQTVGLLNAMARILRFFFFRFDLHHCPANAGPATAGTMPLVQTVRGARPH